MMTVAEQKAVINAVPEDLRKQQQLECPSDYSGYRGIQRDGYVYYPDIHTIVVDDAIGVHWATKGDDLQPVDLNNPEHLERLIEPARRKINAKLYVCIEPARKDPSMIGYRIMYDNPHKRDGRWLLYHRIPFDGGYICYRTCDYELDKDQDMLLVAKAIFVMAKYNTFQVFPYVFGGPEQWEVND